jgi:hypothetical protein
MKRFGWRGSPRVSQITQVLDSAVRTSSVVASSAICGNRALRLLRWASLLVSVMASVTMVSS